MTTESLLSHLTDCLLDHLEATCATPLPPRPGKIPSKLAISGLSPKLEPYDSTKSKTLLQSHIKD